MANKVNVPENMNWFGLILLKERFTFIKTLFVIIVFLSCDIFLFGKNVSIDSLENQLKKVSGEEKVLTLSRLVRYLPPEDSAKIYEYAKKSLRLSEKLNLGRPTLGSIIYLAKDIPYREGIRKLEKLKSELDQNKDQRSIAFANSQIGRQYLRLNNYDSAFKYQQLAIQQFETLNDVYGQSTSLERLGLIHMVRNEYLQALEYYFKALQINRASNFEYEEARSLYHIGLSELYLSNYRVAIDYILQALKYYEKENFTANIWNCNELIGNIYIQLEDFDKALRYHRIALSIRQNTIEERRKRGGEMTPNHMLGIAYSYNNIAEVYLKQGVLDSAKYYALESLKLKNNPFSSASTNDKANSELNVGNIYLETGEMDSAVHYIANAAEKYKSIENWNAYADALYSKGKYHFKKGDFILAEKNFIDGLSHAQSAGSKINIQKGFELLADLNKAKGNYQEAFEYQNNYH